MHRKLLGPTLTLAVLVLAGAGCSDERIVYRDLERFDPLPAGAGSFLGFTRSNSETTVCGTCHVAKQDAWAKTAHATAWESLTESGHAQPMCEGCHTTGIKGNGASATLAGYDATKDARYHGVQCENCHGPGEAHVLNPGTKNVPLASMAQSLDPKSNAGCGSCHQGSHHPYLEEWSVSPHGAMPFTSEDPGHIVEGAGTECQGCHTGEWSLRKSPTSTASTDRIGFKAGVTSGYKEANTVVTASNYSKITCLVCHDPHNTRNPSQLRFPVATADTLQNLCIRCHSRRPNLSAAPTSFRGPHSAGGQVVVGLNAGWRPPTMAQLPAKIGGSHADPQSNPKQCVTCHMPRYSFSDGSATTGHIFNAFACKGADGKPTANTDCSIDQRSFKSCTGAGCHGTEAAAKSAYITVEHRLEYLMEDLKELLENTAKVPCSEFVYGKTLTTALGARYNYLLTAGHGHQVVDECSALQGGNLIRSLPDPVPSHGAVAHNPFYLEQLLTHSITAVKATYYK